jgi:hypothetical protein
VIAPEEAIVATVIVDGNRRSEVFSYEKAGRRLPLLRIVDQDGMWYVEQNGQRQKWRPFEATLGFNSAYFFKSLSDLIFLVDAAQFDTARFEKREGNVLIFRVPVSGEERALLARAISTLDELKKSGSKTLSPEVEQQVLTAKTKMSHGTSLRIDESTGAIVETEIQTMTIKLQEFAWLEKAPADAFALSREEWSDHSAAWTDPENWVTVLYDSKATRGTKTPNLDGYLVHTVTGEMRRLPFRGANVMPLCFWRIDIKCWLA